jgi:hypothetical protein
MRPSRGATAGRRARPSAHPPPSGRAPSAGRPAARRAPPRAAPRVRPPGSTATPMCCGLCRSAPGSRCVKWPRRSASMPAACIAPSGACRSALRSARTAPACGPSRPRRAAARTTKRQRPARTDSEAGPLIRAGRRRRPSKPPQPGSRARPATAHEATRTRVDLLPAKVQRAKAEPDAAAPATPFRATRERWSVDAILLGVPVKGWCALGKGARARAMPGPHGGRADLARALGAWANAGARRSAQIGAVLI